MHKDIFTPPSKAECDICKFFKKGFCTLTSMNIGYGRKDGCTGFREIEEK